MTIHDSIHYGLEAFNACCILYVWNETARVERLCGDNETAHKSEQQYVRQRLNTVWDSINVHVLKFNALAGHVGGKFERIEAKETIVFSPIQKGDDK